MHAALMLVICRYEGGVRGMGAERAGRERERDIPQAQAWQVCADNPIIYCTPIWTSAKAAQGWWPRCTFSCQHI